MEAPLGICPLKLLLLTLSTTRLFINSHGEDGNLPVNLLLEIFSTCSSRRVEDCSSCRSPLSWLKLTSRTRMLLENISSSGMLPDNLLEARKIPVTVISELQLIPSHLQQSVVFSQEPLRPPS
uniref:F-box domain-containing protein n=1 Tax=Setaria italica TaxID=4555 RepID=K3Z0V0_SETIT